MTYSRKFNFKNNTFADAEQIDAEFDQLIAAVNNIETSDNQKDSDLRKIAQLSKMTGDTGGIKFAVNAPNGDILQELITRGQGFGTFYAQGGSKNMPPSNLSIRGISHFTSPDIGWVWSTDYRNKLFTNYYDSGGWKGWSRLLMDTDTQDTLWSGAAYVHETYTVTPTKKLSECRNGWMLLWSDYDAGKGSNDYNFLVSYIPKVFPTLFSGKDMYFPLIGGMTDTTVYNTGKVLNVYDDKFTGNTVNDSPDNGAQDICLRRVIEW